MSVATADSPSKEHGSTPEPTPNREVQSPLWTHPSPDSTAMADFLSLVSRRHGLGLRDYHDLHRWSVTNIATFWAEAWAYCGIRTSRGYDRVVADEHRMWPRPAWFPGARLNFAENLLHPTRAVPPDAIAVIAASEIGSREELTWAELRSRVRGCQAGMRRAGVEVGDRVAAYTANHTQALVAMLAATALGAVWTAVSSDAGVTAALDRLVQIGPVVLFVDREAVYNGKRHAMGEKVRAVVEGLPSVKAVVVFDSVIGSGAGEEDGTGEGGIELKAGRVETWDDFVSSGDGDNNDLHFEQLPPDHPVYILYSSGTTGPPKCIVHGAIGTLLQHKKEHMLHCDIKPGSRIFYFTTCTWMMWHWLVSALASGATIILYDGSPFRSPCPTSTDNDSLSVIDDLAMPRLIDELHITHFGTSAKYLSTLEQRNVRPRESLHLSTLQAIYSTGSPLPPSTFGYVYKTFPQTVNLGSITGGTDIISLFGAPCPLLPVYTGEIQCLGLGMAVRTFDEGGEDVTDEGREGELVCVRPFPCQPVYFWADDHGADGGGGDCGGEKYRSSYFERFNAREDAKKPVWCHGDYVRVNPHTRGIVMLGRSDGVLKPAGVRFGSAEIYNVCQRFFPDSIADALCVGRVKPDAAGGSGGDEEVCLFIKLPESAQGKGLTAEYVKEIRAVIRRELSARHVPAVVEECPDIPVTTNGKKVEGAVKKILSGKEARASASVANPKSLTWFREWAKKDNG